MLIGGLGVGYSLRRATEFPNVRAIDVVEIEGAVIAWHEKYLGHITDAAMRDPRVSVHEADIMSYLWSSSEPYDVICLDTDNGPNWLVFDENRDLYEGNGLDLLWSRLASGGVLATWSASRDTAYEERLAERFGDVDLIETPVPRGHPDVVYLARRGG
jgi:spermidine synthase